MNWTNSSILSFLRLYKGHPCIWNPKHTLNKDRLSVNEAWADIQDSMPIPCTIPQLKKKKESLMSAYRCYKTRIRTSLNEKGETTYKPSWFAFKTMDSFMSSVYMPKSEGEEGTPHAVEELEEDMENYLKFKLIGGKLKLKQGVFPHKFECQKPQKRKIDRPDIERQDIEYEIVKSENQDSNISECQKPQKRKIDRPDIERQDIEYEIVKSENQDSNISECQKPQKRKIDRPDIERQDIEYEIVKCENQDSNISENSDPLTIPEEIDIDVKPDVSITTQENDDTDEVETECDDADAPPPKRPKKGRYDSFTIDQRELDEIEVMTRIWGRKLRKIPQERRDFLIYKINNLIYSDNMQQNQNGVGYPEDCSMERVFDDQGNESE